VAVISHSNTSHVRRMGVIKTQGKRESGFTLIELMVTVGILAMMAMIDTPAFMSMMPGMRLNGATRQVMGDLMAARMKAVKLNHRTKVIFDSSSQYRICDDADNNGSVADGEGDVKTKNIQDHYSDVTFSSTNNPIFSPRGSAASLPTVTLQNSSGTKTVTVSIAGRVKIN